MNGYLVGTQIDDVVLDLVANTPKIVWADVRRTNITKEALVNLKVPGDKKLTLIVDSDKNLSNRDNITFMDRRF